MVSGSSPSEYQITSLHPVKSSSYVLYILLSHYCEKVHLHYQIHRVHMIYTVNSTACMHRELLDSGYAPRVAQMSCTGDVDMVRLTLYMDLFLVLRR